jgi:integrase
VTETFGQLRAAGYQKKGTPVRSQKAKAVQKRKERAEGRKDRGKPRKGLGEKSIKNLRTTLRTVLVYAVKWGYLDRLPELPQVRVPESTFDWYQPAEAARLLGCAANEWERAVLMFPLHTGARMGEQRAIRWSDVDFALHRIHIRRSAPKWFGEEKAPKSNRQRWVDLTPELAAALRAVQHHGELVFCNDDGSKLAPGQFHEILWAAQRRAGLRRIKWHELRHSFASILASGGMPLFVLRALLGHSSVKMTERYAHLAAGQSAAFAHLLSAAAPAHRPPSDIESTGPQAGPSGSRPLN